MSLSTWKQFSFLFYNPIKDPNFNSDSLLFSDDSLSAITSSEEYVFFAVEDRVIKIIDLQFNLVQQFIGFEAGFRILFFKFSSINSMDVLCAIGSKEGAPLSMKLWNLKKLLLTSKDKQLNNSNKIDDFTHHYLTHVQVSNGNNQFPLSAFVTSDDFAVSAFGFANGSTIIVRGKLMNDKGARQRIIYESNGEPITGLHLIKSDQPSTVDYYLYILTTSNIYLFDTTGKLINTPIKTLDVNNGSDILCNDILNKNSSLVTSNSNLNSIDFYDSKFGKINSIKVFNNISINKIFNYDDKYLVIVALVDSEIAQSILNEGSPNSSFTGILDYNSKFKPTRILVIDFVHNYIVFNLTLSNSISRIFTFQKNLFCLSSNGILYKLQEKTINEKISILIDRELFPSAIQLIQEEIIRNSHSDITQNDLLLTYKKYGDFLYSRGEYQQAIDQYILSIELKRTGFNLDIILKFRNNDKILYLSEYLERLCFDNIDVFESQILTQLGPSKDSSPNEDYLTLLLCNYCKLKDRKKLENFILKLENMKNKYDESDDEYEVLFHYANVNFDLNLILDLLSKIKFYDVVLKLSFIFNYHTMIIDTLINVYNNYRLCLVFLRHLRISDSFNLLLINSSNNYLKTMLKRLPIETTNMLIDIFTGVYEPNASAKFVYQSICDIDKSDSSHNTNSDATASTKTDLLPNDVFSSMFEALNIRNFSSQQEDNNSSHPTYQPPKPKLVFMSFVDNPEEFITFLEAVLQNYSKFDKFNSNIKDKTDLLITLFEMYLSLTNAEGFAESSKIIWKQKAVQLYQNNEEIMDANKVLLLCQINDFSYEDLLLRMPYVSKDQEADVQSKPSNLDAASTSSSIYKLDDIFSEYEKAGIDLYGKNKKFLIKDDLLETLEGNRNTPLELGEEQQIEFLRNALLMNNIEKAIFLLNSFGNDIPELYSITLFYVVNKNSEEFLINTFGLKNFITIIYKLLNTSVLTIIDLLNILSINDMMKFKYLQKFLIHYLEFKNSEIKKNEKLTAYYQQEINSKKIELAELINKSSGISQIEKEALVEGATIGSSGENDAFDDDYVVINNLKCHLCLAGLDIPIVHFLCGHTFHHRCLDDFEYDTYSQNSVDDRLSTTQGLRCPKCISDQEASKSLKASQTEVSERLDLFINSIEESPDKFKIVTDFLGRGVLENGIFTALE